MNTYIEDNSDQISSSASSHSLSDDPAEHAEVSYARPPAEPMHMTAKSKDGLRKGKWTPEEELYTNKVIKVFNAGLLKLSDSERGITLRAYLADKLQCDPMRITKKYTGASCLGKRVFHFDYQHADHAEAERARQELQILENNFRMKLEIINKKRLCDARCNGDATYSISTPAIDALLHRNRTNNTMMPMMFPFKGGVDGSSGPFAFPSKAFFAAAAASYRHHQLQQYQQQQQQSHAQFVPRSNGVEALMPPSGTGPIHFIPPSNTNTMPFPAYFHPSMMPPQIMNNTDERMQVPIASAADLRLPLFPSLGRVASWKDFSPNNLPMTASVDEHKDKKSRTSISDADAQAAALFGSQENLLLSIASFDEDPLDPSKHVDNEHNVAACSLLGFSNDVRRNNSQESFVEFFETAQKNATCTSDEILSVPTAANVVSECA